jgi:hypothetical protein
MEHVPKSDIFTESYTIKSNIKNGEYDVILIGGSNITSGISPTQLEYKGFRAVNLGLVGGGGNFDRYSEWLYHKNLHAEYIIFSPIELWSSDIFSHKDLTNELDIIPPLSLAVKLKSLLVGKVVTNNVAPINYENGEYINIIYGNAWEVQLHLMGRTYIKIDKHIFV